MEVKYTKRFLKDLSKIPSKQREPIEDLVFTKLLESEDLRPIPNIKKLSQDPFYRIRIGDYRIGFEKQADGILLCRVLGRKDIYKFFP